MMLNVDPASRDKAQKIVNDNLSKLTNAEIKALFKEVNETNTPLARVKEIVEEISGYIGFLIMPIAQHYFYRARYWGDETGYPKCLSDLLEPLPNRTSQGRCNVEGKPVLYVSTHPDTLVPECHYKSGDIYAMAQFDRSLKTEDLSCLMLGIDPHHRFGGSPEMDNIRQFKKDFFGDNYQKYQYIETLLHSQFVRDDDRDGVIYRFTAALCQKYFSSCPDLDAIVYPSIATQGAFNNLAIRSGLYKKAYIATKVGIFEVLSDGESRQLAGAIVKADGSLKWVNMSIIDSPKAVSIRKIDPDDPRIYIAPWKTN